MAEKGRRGVGWVDAAAVIGDADKADAAVLDFHRDDSGARVNGIFYQFLDNGGRPLDDLARRNQFGHFFGQYMDLGHLVPPVMYYS